MGSLGRLFEWFTKGVFRKLAIAMLLYRIYHKYLRRKQLSLKNQTCLVTGAAAGIGREIAREFAKKGANLVLWDVNTEGIKETRRQIESSFPSTRVASFSVDLQDRENIYAVAQQVLAQGPVNVVVNNAGIQSGGLFLQVPDSNIIRTMNVNALSHVWTMKAFLPSMIQRNSGHICSIASVAGLLGAPGMVDYSTSKFAAVGFLDALRLELKKIGASGVTTTLVCPAHVKTELFKEYRSIWLAPSLTPEEVASEAVNAIERRDEVLLMPISSYLGVALKALAPVGFTDWLADVTGVTSAMDDIISKHKGSFK